MTKVIDSLSNWQLVRKTAPDFIGFVPTMGNLHEGHVSLLQESIRENSTTVLSIFVNPTQFDNEHDLKSYPQTLEQDIAIAEKNNVDYVLLPKYRELYTDDYVYKITCMNDTPQLETSYRPGHFDGVLTVVMKLLLLIKPARAYFGEKDYQQLELVKGLVKAFFLDTEIIQCKTIRNEFGLPLSSRNNRLTEEQYQLAQWFPKIFHSGQSCEDIKQQLIQQGLSVDYIEDHNGRRFAAVKVGDIRLIDNIVFSEDSK